mmetsp:Transcript_31034/g.100241  ORF Transcript_31034/g.100241 Transcript_31034/m.100241 type:complete len:200 (+) Transcript_31034:315-914(+)
MPPQQQPPPPQLPPAAPPPPRLQLAQVVVGRGSAQAAPPWQPAQGAQRALRAVAAGCRARPLSPAADHRRRSSFRGHGSCGGTRAARARGVAERAPPGSALRRRRGRARAARRRCGPRGSCIALKLQRRGRDAARTGRPDRCVGGESRGELYKQHLSHARPRRTRHRAARVASCRTKAAARAGSHPRTRCGSCAGALLA